MVESETAVKKARVLLNLIYSKVEQETNIEIADSHEDFTGMSMRQLKGTLRDKETFTEDEVERFLLWWTLNGLADGWLLEEVQGS